MDNKKEKENIHYESALFVDKDEMDKNKLQEEDDDDDNEIPENEKDENNLDEPKEEKDEPKEEKESVDEEKIQDALEETENQTETEEIEKDEQLTEDDIKDKEDIPQYHHTTYEEDLDKRQISYGTAILLFIITIAVSVSIAWVAFSNKQEKRIISLEAQITSMTIENSRLNDLNRSMKDELGFYKRGLEEIRIEINNKIDQLLNDTK